MAFLKKLYSYLYFHSWRLGFWSPPDRRILSTKILRFFSESKNFENILFVGVQDYCAPYKELFHEKKFYTLDPDPGLKDFSELHKVGRLQDLKDCFPMEFKFDAIIINGVLGYGIDSVDEAKIALDEALLFLKKDGVLVFGLNHHLFKRDLFFELTQSLSPWSIPTLNCASLDVKMPLHGDLTHSYYFFKMNEEIHV